jgi:hypothetical protein
MPALDQIRLKVRLRDSYQAVALASPKQNEAVHPRPDCFGGEG